MNNTLTLALDGDVPLDEFAKAIQGLHQLITELSKEVANDTQIDWLVDDLQSGSAIATIEGVSLNEPAVESVIEAYLAVGQALERGSPIPYSPKIQQHAHKITNVINGSITAVRFETARAEALVASRTGESPLPSITYAYGIVSGVVQALSSRRGLRFTLYDSIFDKSVSCYLHQGQEEIMRDAWGNRVVVSGRIGRSPKNGRPTTIRDIRKVDVIAIAESGSYRHARGILPMEHGKLPEDVIRRMRDA